jgi:thiamine-monophosphate kinase
MPDEFDFIQWLRAQQKPSPLVPVPAGDDMAVLKWPADDLLLVGVDQVLDGVHFDSAVHSPRAIGAKVMNRNLSDCAAMACLPAAAVVSAALPRGAGVDYAKELYLGMREAGERFGCEIVGGDTGSWAGKLALSVTILGRSAGIKPITRAGARPGDFIVVTGPLGGSILGRHMTFAPRVHEARELAGTGKVTAMIDLSDGLSRDLAHVCRESGVGAVIEADRVPVHEDAVAMRRDGHSPLEHALHDGEDHELLVCVRVGEGLALASAPRIAAEFGGGEGMTVIGQITAEPGIRLRTADGDVPLAAKAWEHRL